MKTTPNTPRHLAVAATALALLLALRAHAATFTLNPSADAFVTTGPTANLGGNNYGGAGALSVAAAGLANGEFQSVLRFDLSTARASFDTQFGAGQWSIQSITLSLTATSPNNAIFNPSAAGQFGVSWMQNDSWTEGSGTPAAPTTTGITYTSLTGTFIGASDEALGSFSFAGIIPHDRSDIPAVGAVISLTPPAVGDAEVEDPVGHHFDAARAARLIGPAGGVEPDVHALNKMPGDPDIIILDEENPSPETLILTDVNHLFDDIFPHLVIGMRLAGEDDMHRPRFMVDDPGQTVQV